MRQLSRAAASVAAAVVGMAVPAWAATVTWDGGGISSNGGVWNPADPGAAGVWDTNNHPTAADVATLPNVNSGTRTVTLASATTVASLVMPQWVDPFVGGPPGVNVLSLDAPLSLMLAAGTAVSAAGTPQLSRILFKGPTLAVGTGSPPASGYAITISPSLYLNQSGSSVKLESASGTHSTLAFGGTVAVSADASLTRVYTGSSAATGDLAVRFLDGAAVSISTGTLDLSFSGRKNGDLFRVFNQTLSSIYIDPGAAMAVRYQASSASNSGLYAVSLSNLGLMMHGGSLALQASRAGTTELTNPTPNTIVNTGAWWVNGAAAEVKRLTNFVTSDYQATPLFLNNGQLRGNSGLDALEYNEEALIGGVATRMTLVNAGTISPGSSLMSIGTLALRDIDVTFGAHGRLNLDVAGTAAGQYDVLALQGGATDSAGAGTLDLTAAGDTLAISFGFTPTGDFEIPIITYGQVNLVGGVGFDVLMIGGATQFAPTYSDGRGVYSVQYGAAGANLVYTTPEPGCLSLLLATAAGLMRRRRAGPGRSSR